MAKQSKELKNLIKIRRLPPLKILRAVHLGLTFAFLNSAAAVLFYDGGTFFTTFLWLKILIIFALFLFTYLGGWTFAGALIAFLVSNYLLKNVQVEVLSQFYGLGFLFGYVFAYIYNQLVHLMMLWRKNYKVAFFYNTARTLNIIKSPNDNELEEDWLNEIEKERHKLYHYKVDQPVAAPYTITIIANPNVRINLENEQRATVEPDPILQDRNLFLLSVDKLLHSFESDPVLGRPEIWSRVRVITIFDPAFETAKIHSDEPIYFAKRFGFQVTQNSVKQSDNILSPAQKMWSTLVSLMTSNQANNDSHTSMIIDKILLDTDVLYTFSAHADYVRASAFYADGDEIVESFEISQQSSDEIFKIRPVLGEKNDVSNFLNPDSFSLTRERTSRHEAAVLVPGKIALNVLTATRKTFIHEFAHAMSSIKNGAITDEYFDTFDIQDDTTTTPPANADETAFYVNRLERNPVSGGMPGIPRTFMEYNGALYNSDIDHPSGEENWLGYFPERKGNTAGCTMDRTYGSYQFDDLLSQFIYDRMIAKLNRTENRKGATA